MSPPPNHGEKEAIFRTPCQDSQDSQDSQYAILRTSSCQDSQGCVTPTSSQISLSHSPDMDRNSGSPDSGILQDEEENPASSVGHIMSRLVLPLMKERDAGSVDLSLHNQMADEWGDVEDSDVDEVAAALVQLCGDTESSVRRMALECLERLCMKFGEKRLETHLKKLTNSRRKLVSLHLYKARTDPKTTAVARWNT